ncbi:hypothetical protein [Paenibacillus validus]|uniref:hypothetical protein n=1 Tax=Paenibacillus validus TaxID=44253 RepID=UPI003D296361
MNSKQARWYLWSTKASTIRLDYAASSAAEAASDAAAAVSVVAVAASGAAAAVSVVAVAASDAAAVAAAAAAAAAVVPTVVSQASFLKETAAGIEEKVTPAQTMHLFRRGFFSTRKRLGKWDNKPYIR